MVKSVLQQMNSTDYIKPLFEELKKFSEQVEEAKENPDSVYNYYRYSRKLEDFHWTWPYGMDTNSLLNVIETIESETDLDSWLLEYFDENKIESLLNDIYSGISVKYREALEQINIGLKYNTYILVNNMLLSIIDGILSKYMANKKQLHRRGILEPVIEFYDDNYSLENIPFIFKLGMLNENIAFIFEDTDFNKDNEVKTNKKIRRHSSVHGMAFSNKKNDTMFLLNALYWLVELDEVLLPFENTLKEKNRMFRIKSDCINEITTKISDYLKLNGGGHFDNQL